MKKVLLIDDMPPVVEQAGKLIKERYDFAAWQPGKDPVEQIRSENDALETRINTSIDLDHIYDVAVRELGMVSANRGQIIRYKNTESEYVRQYEDIPGQAPRGKVRR